jgi:hypothetical protein
MVNAVSKSSTAPAVTVGATRVVHGARTVPRAAVLPAEIAAQINSACADLGSAQSLPAGCIRRGTAREFGMSLRGGGCRPDQRSHPPIARNADRIHRQHGIPPTWR